MKIWQKQLGIRIDRSSIEKDNRTANYIREFVKCGKWREESKKAARDFFRSRVCTGQW